MAQSVVVPGVVTPNTVDTGCIANALTLAVVDLPQALYLNCSLQQSELKGDTPPADLVISLHRLVI